MHKLHKNLKKDNKKTSAVNKQVKKASSKTKHAKAKRSILKMIHKFISRKCKGKKSCMKKAAHKIRKHHASRKGMKALKKKMNSHVKDL